MEGVVGHEDGGAVVQDKEGAGVGLAEEAAVSDAAPTPEDVVGENGEVAGDVGVAPEVISVLIEAAGAALEVDDFVCCHNGGYVGRAYIAVVVDAGVGVGDGLTAAG